MREKTPKDLTLRTKDFAVAVIKMVSALPGSTAAHAIGEQVLRSGTSVGADYREANRAGSKSEFISKIGDCLKELDETAYWLELLAESLIVPNRRLSSLRDECDQLISIFTVISKNLHPSYFAYRLLPISSNKEIE